MAILVKSPNGKEVPIASLSLASTAAYCAGKHIVVTAPTTEANDITWPSDRTIEIRKNSIVTFSGTKKMTFADGSQLPIAGLYQIFAGTQPVAGLKGSIPAVWFGITGTADDVGINKAIKALSSGKVKLAPKRHYIAASISMIGSRDITLSGYASFNNANVYDSNFTTELYLVNGAECDVIKAADSTVDTPDTNTNIGIKNLKINGNKVNNPSITNVGIRFDGNIEGRDQNRAIVQNVEVRGCGGDGIASWQREITYRDVRCVLNGRNGFYNFASADSYFYNCLSDDNGLSGFYVRNANYMFGINSYQNAAHGIHIFNGSDNQYHTVELNGNEKCGIYVEATNASFARHNKVFGGLISNNSWKNEGAYSNCQLDGAGLSSIDFYGVRFFDTEPTASPGETSNKVKYCIEDTRTLYVADSLQGKDVGLYGCKITSDPTFVSSGSMSANFADNAYLANLYDHYVGGSYDLEKFYETQISGATANVLVRAQCMYLSTSDATTAVTLLETGLIYKGKEVEIINSGTNTLTFADVANVQEVAGTVTLGQYDSIRFRRVSDRWIMTGTSNN